MPPRHVCELRIAPRSPHGEHVADYEDNQPCDPELEAQSDGPGKRSIGDCQPTRRAAEQDMLGQRTVYRDHEPIRQSGRAVCHQTSAPPPKEKNERKKEDAAKAIDSPNTI